MKLYYVFILFIFLSNCQFYQNIVGKYNTYFLANEKMSEIEQKLFPLVQEDFNHYLPVLVNLDTAKGNKMLADLNYVIEKASIPIRRLKRSKWVDDCYLLIGKARLYQGDIQNAITTFNYITNNSLDENIRHAAFVMLLKTFMFTREYNNFYFVKNYILERESVFNHKNSKDYHLTLAHFYYTEKEYNRVLEHLNLTFKHLKTRLEKAHYSYLLAQIYEKQNQQGFAFEYYSKAKKFSPNYKLFFHAQIHAYRLQYLQDLKDTTRVTNYYRHLLKESKNWELRDKIYFEMGNYQVQNKNFEEAVFYYKESINLSEDSKHKGYTFFKLADLYDKTFVKYRMAADYYDSAFMNLPEYYEVYPKVQTKAKVFKNFAKYYDLVGKQKNLLSLYNLPIQAQKEHFKKEIIKEKELIIKQIELSKLSKVRRRLPNENDLNTQNSISGFETGDQKGAWYFHNTRNRILGQSAFLRTWGDRPLRDNWRLSSRLSNEKIKFKNVEEFQKLANKKVDKPLKKQESKDLFSAVIPIEKRLEEVPKNLNELTILKIALGQNLLNLGLSYQDDLMRYQLALQIFQEIINQNYKAQEAKALYLAFLLCKEYFDLNCNSDTYKSQLFNKYPSNFLTYLARNPNYETQQSLQNRKISRTYYRIYKSFENEEYLQTLAQIDEAIFNYPNSSYKDKFYFLRVIVLGKQKKYTLYVEALRHFIKDFSDSPLKTEAERLLMKYEEWNIKN